MDSGIECMAQDFMKQLEHEIICQAESVNHQPDDGDLQDGFLLDRIADGWVAYKGMSWGFVLVPDPLRLSMSFGNQGPFGRLKSHKQELQGKIEGDRLVWIDESDPKIQFSTPADVAAYGLQSLAAEVHDEIPELSTSNEPSGTVSR